MQIPSGFPVRALPGMCHKLILKRLFGAILRLRHIILLEASRRTLLQLSGFERFVSSG